MVAFVKWLWREGRTQATAAGVSYLVPLVGSAMTLASAYITHIALPLPYVITATALTFMALAVGTQYFLNLLYERNPEGKFGIGPIVLGKVYEKRDGANRLAHIKYSFLHKNLAKFPIQFVVTPRRASLGASINPNPVRNVTGGISQIGATGMFSEAGIPVTDAMRGQLVEGEYEVDYCLWPSRKN